MFSELAYKNVRRSMKDYLIYLLTLTFGVCLFYMFNSIDAQAAMMTLSSAQADYLQTLSRSIDYISVFISVVLGFLVVYANGFLIKRRKKELGIYLTLGMDKGRLSRLLMLETFFIGLFALAVGLVVGVFASQGFSVVTARMFKANLDNFHFVYSGAALKKTLLYFGIIFLVVMVFNGISVSRLKLIDLLAAEHKNQEFKAKKLWISVVCFIVSVACLGYAYYLIDRNGFVGPAWEFETSIILGCIGTLLFFFSLSGFLLRVVQGNQKTYYKGLNMFTLRQFNTKINTTFVSVSIICIMLLVTIGTLSTGMSMASALAGNVEATTPFDMSVQRYTHEGREPVDLAASLRADGLDLDAVGAKYAQVGFYYAKDTKLGDLCISDETIKFLVGEVDLQQFRNAQIGILSESDYNGAAALQGKPTVSLGEDGFAIYNDIENVETDLNAFLASGKTLTVSGKTLHAVETKTISLGLETGGGGGLGGVIIVPDTVAKDGNCFRQVLNVNFAKGSAAQAFSERAKAYYGEMGEKHDRPYDSITTRRDVSDRAAGMSTVISYLILYIALVFLITSAAILAIQQLSESSDNAERYGLLRELGADEKMINHALFTQIGLYFLLPLSLAIVHSYVGIRVVNRLVEINGHSDVAKSTFIAAAVFVVIYGGYFLATYFGSKNMLRTRTED
ncbi:MAG: FtsX-like permease family protein [Oscillospiraceae bacterium]|jgi:putative ABC transport system permease protein